MKSETASPGCPFRASLMRAGSCLRTAGHEPRRAGPVLCPLLLLSGVQAQPPAEPAAAVGRTDLCVTEGSLAQDTDGSLSVDVPKMRAFVLRPVADAVAARLTYRGPTDEQSALGSGEVRRQFALKLRALDACNLVYVTWRITPASKLVVQVKNNPGQHSSSECTNHGYQTLKPRLAAPLPPLLPGETHLLRAEIALGTLRAFVDGRPVWEGELGAFAAMSAAPVGVRSDNVRASFRLEAGPGVPIAAAQLPACRTGPESAE